MVKKILRVLKAPHIEDKDLQRNAHLLHAILLTLMTAAFIIPPLLVLMNPAHGSLQTLLIGFTTGLTSLGMLVAIQRCHIKKTSIILVTFLFLIMLINLLVFGGARNTIGFFLTILITALLLGTKATTLVTICSCITIIGFYLFNGSLNIKAVTLFPLMELAIIIVFLILSSLLLRFAVNSITQALNQARVNEEALQNARIELETRVASRTVELADANKELQKEIIERKQMEERLLQAQKMEAIGRLAGGVAHDFNNLLTAIVGYTDLLLINLPQDDPAQSKLEEIKKASHRAVDLTRRLLAFSRKQIMQPKVFNLNDVIKDTDKMLQHIIGEDIELIINLQSNLSNTRADPIQIGQIIVNMAVNSRDAMPQGGSLTISTRDVYLDRSVENILPEAKSGFYVEMVVQDSGIGMDKETQAHIFEPFFTTKGKDKGTGLGLASIYGIVSQSGGAIKVNSSPGKGTTFSIFLPAVQDSIELRAEKITPTLRESGGETILLVEDEDIVRHFVSQVLHEAGYRVFSAKNSQKALELCDMHQASLELLITDVVIPGGLSGVDLAKKIMKKKPGIQVLYISGYTDESIIRHGILKPEVHFLQKPFSHERLLLLVGKILKLSQYQKSHQADQENFS